MEQGSMISSRTRLRGYRLIGSAVGMLWREKRDVALILGTFAVGLPVFGLFVEGGNGGVEFCFALISYIWFQRFHLGNWPAKFEFRRVLYLFWTRLKLIVPLGVPVLAYAIVFHEKKTDALDLGLLLTWLIFGFWLYQRCSLAFPANAVGNRMKLRESFKLTRGNNGALLLVGIVILVPVLVTFIALLSFSNPAIVFAVNILGNLVITALAYSINSEIYRLYEKQIAGGA